MTYGFIGFAKKTLPLQKGFLFNTLGAFSPWVSFFVLIPALFAFFHTCFYWQSYWIAMDCTTHTNSEWSEQDGTNNSCDEQEQRHDGSVFSQFRKLCLCVALVFLLWCSVLIAYRRLGGLHNREIFPGPGDMVSHTQIQPLLRDVLCVAAFCVRKVKSKSKK